MDVPRQTVSTAALKAADVPSPDGSLDEWRGDEPPELWWFASSYEPPADFPNLFELAQFVTDAAVKQWSETNELPALGLGGLRLTLWWLFHHWRHTQSEGSWEKDYPEYAGYVRATVTKIHLELFQEESWWWEPGHIPTAEEREGRALARANEGRGVAQLYGLAADILSQAIEVRDTGEDDPFNLPLIEFDVVHGARVYAAYALARGLTMCGGGRSLEEARDVAYHEAAVLAP